VSCITAHVNPMPSRPAEITLRQFVGLDPAPAGTSETDGLLGRMEQAHRMSASAEPSAEERAQEIVQAGRKWGSHVLRDDEPPSAHKPRRRH
jgi:hypothetical protein